ncbi:branched-chain amino acid ABC transporter permease [Oligella ureolytica]
MPLFATNYFLSAILIPFLILSLAAIGLNVLVGYCGQISLGSGAFMAVGAYVAWNFGVRIPEIPLIVQKFHWWALANAFRKFFFGIPSLRIRGLYLAVATLAAQFFVDWLFLRIPFLTNYSASGSVSVGRLDFCDYGYKHHYKSIFSYSWW